MRILTGNEVSSLLRHLDPPQARRLLDALSSGLASYTSQKKSTSQPKTIHQPLRTVISTQNNDTTLIMPVSDTTHTVVKVATVPHTGDIQGAITIYNAGGELEGLLNAAEITAFRTALATMTVLTRWPAPPKPNIVVFGAGKQAEWHIRLALLLIPGVRHVSVVNRSQKRLDELQRNTIEPLTLHHQDVQFEMLLAKDIQEQLANADIICCCTPSKEPLFPAAVLKREMKSRFLSLIGSYKPEMQEVDGETLEMASQIYVDSTEACLEEAGELIRAGVKSDDLIEVGEVFSREEDRQSKLEDSSGLTIFKCVGLAIMDLIIAKALLEMAGELGKGTVVDSF